MSAVALPPDQTGPAALSRAQIDSLDWSDIVTQLDRCGFAVVRRLLAREDCEALQSAYAFDRLFRKRVVMARHGFGRGEYRYFAYPLPEPIASLRTLVYPKLAQVANRWHEQLKIDSRFPLAHAEYLHRCHVAGQCHPTPLLLRYSTHDYNCLHQDLYGEEVFPLQLAVLLSQPGEDFSGGEFVITEQRPRMQSRVSVVPLSKGDAVVFAVHHRPVQGSRGVYRVNLRHGVSSIRSGERFAAGIIFHDAK